MIAYFKRFFDPVVHSLDNSDMFRSSSVTENPSKDLSFAERIIRALSLLNGLHCSNSSCSLV